MSILRSVRSEVAGAWRSLRYDLGHRSAPASPPAEGHPDVTSMGLSTFGGPATGLTGGVPAVLDGADPASRPPRRLAAVSAIGLLALTGAAGSYLAVLNGLGTLGADRPTAQQPLPPVVEPSPSAVPSLGRGPRPAPTDRATERTPPPTGRAVAVRNGTPAPSPSRSQQVPIRPRPLPPPAPSPTCDCPTPPVPTPASPSQPGDSSGTPTPAPTSGAPYPTASPTGTGSEPPRESRGY